MFQKYISRRRNFSIFSFIVGLAVLFYFSFLSFRQIKVLEQSEQLLTQSYQVKVLLEQIISYSNDIETERLAYAITNDTEFIKPIGVIQSKLDTLYNKVNLLTKDNPMQQKNLSEIKPLIDQRIAVLQDNNTILNAVSMDAASVKTKIKNETESINALHQKISSMVIVEDKLLSERKAEHKSVLTKMPYFAMLLLAFSIFKFLISFYVINNDFKRINKVSNELKLINDSFEHAQEIANISHWQWDLETNKQIFSDNQYVLLGCKPGEFEPTFEAYLNFVHPDDRAKVLKENNDLLTNNIANDSVYRIIRKDGELRYFKSVGRLITDENGKKVIIVTKYDITDQYLISKELEERNAELTNTNTELASFNYIASHDLQEPLRKIQLFISKIFDDKELQLSEKNLDYFKRMQTVANRMQNLIEDLLIYSRTNASEKSFEPTDINLIVENIKNEIIADEAKADKDITINFKDLPVVNGISFQLKQLFSNLIDNSVKYSNPMLPLVINIESSIVDGVSIQDIPESKMHKKYYQITVTDNGIGFEQYYSKQIFNLFQRLHDKKSFSGTGIGLAICKKVAENHNGFIAASGEINKGAVFTFYMPV